MKKLMYVAVYILALGFYACGSDNDDEFDCSAGTVAIAETGNKYRENSSTDNCEAYKTAMEGYLNNSCTEDKELIKIYLSQLELLGDCTIAGKKCLLCKNGEQKTFICRGENGNAFIQESNNGEITLRDTGVTFDKYVELSNCE
ncbi:hypothetical protein [Aquimarina muelleri]|uniref:Lipoprotein n=1 Tax=Aquimarina muelleri TaxID=279356 RepID=A0A918JW09_9FLAO|nr:hypothetical protein [Aquimarina muelleri]MCX2763197.1 hypothetical protein [Aquimarina muelleri]GGX19890.1 hypothetical protein GCM10007384_21550 [Aquimarina muelleri]